ncbi:MAG: prolipoprotein diacylglyceryl transferase [Kiritimatiellaeota bacterium]|nr:prolipoprotein diacylglyceryl transferase [Kiritimatiellota bacterium]
MTLSNPVAFTLFSHDIRWYGIMFAIGVLSGYFLMQRNRRHVGVSADQVADLTFLMVVAGVVGARLFFVIEFFDTFKHTVINGVTVRRSFPQILLETIRIDHGGLVFYGGCILCVITLFVYCRRKKLDPLRMADLMAPSAALGHAFGRIGCFLNGCCFGTPCHYGWGVEYANAFNVHPGQMLYPVQLFEASNNFLLAVLLCFALRRLAKGQVFTLYLALYGIARFCLEFIRGDNSDFLFGVFSPGQSVALFIVPVSVFFFFYLGYRERKGRRGEEDGAIPDERENAE